MEALWDLEDKWKLTTKDAIAFLACTSFLVTALCIATFLNRRAKRKASSMIHQEPHCMEETPTSETCSDPPDPKPRWDCVKTMLMSSVRWSRVSRGGGWGEGEEEEDQIERPTTLLVSARYEANVGWQSHNSTSPVWQRPILMGEKCELPRFSGLILYDQRGRPLQYDDDKEASDHMQVRSVAAIGTTLKDLL